jgi:replicative DNA helicase
MESIVNIIYRLIPSLEQARKYPHGVSGLPTGFEELDRLSSGWQNGELIVIAAPTCMGKTALALSMLNNAMCDAEFDAFWFSTSLSSLQLTKLMLCNSLQVDMHMLLSGGIDADLLNGMKGKIKFSGVSFDDSPYLTIEDIDSKLSEGFNPFPAEMVVIDDINHLNYAEDNRLDFTDKFYRLKTLARKYEIPIIVLMEIEIPKNVFENYSDCLSAYYQQNTKISYIDILINLFRPEYFKITEFEDGNSSLGYADLIISGSRVEKGMVRLKYDNRIFVSKFENDGK